MWLLKILEKLVSPQIISERQEGVSGAQAPTVVSCTHEDFTPDDEEAMKNAYINENVNAWKQMYQDANCCDPTDEQVESQIITTQYAYSEGERLADAIDYFCTEVYPGDPENVPAWLVDIVTLGIMEYVSGNLSMVQDLFLEEEESE